MKVDSTGLDQISTLNIDKSNIKIVSILCPCQNLEYVVLSVLCCKSFLVYKSSREDAWLIVSVLYEG